MSIFNILNVEEVCQRGSIKNTDVNVFCNTVAQHQVLDQSSIDDLFRIQALCHLQAPEWSEFFIETVTDFLVREKQPTGYLTRDEVRYVMERLERNERLEKKTEFDLLLNLLDKARWVPERLATAALKEVHVAVATGAGVLRGGQERASGEVTVQDIADIRKILYAFGGDESRPLTRTEAEMLFAIDECVDESGESGEWQTLFTLAVANVMLSASGYRAPPRDVAFATYNTNTDHGLDLERAIGAYSRQSSEERALQRLEHQRIEIVTGEQVGEADALWVSERFDIRFQAAPHLMALFAHLRDQEIRLHPVLRNVVLRHAKAA